MSFDTLGLSPKVLEAVIAAGYTTPTAIQAEAIPHALARRDVLGLAQTGSGKTAAFVLPMLTYTLPVAASQELRWRHATMDKAKARAAGSSVRAA